MSAGTVPGDHRPEDGMTMSWTREQARELVERVLSFSKADECDVRVALAQEAYTRFAANNVTTAGSVRSLTINIRSGDGRRTGTTSLNTSDSSAIKEAVAKSETLMQAARPNPEYVEDLGPQTYPQIPAFDEATARSGALERRDGVAAALALAREKGLDAAGFFSTMATWEAIGNKKRNFGYQRRTSASFSTTMRTRDATGSGYAERQAVEIGAVPAAELSAAAARKAQTSAQPRALEPGRYTVILEPQAVSDLLGSFGFLALSMRTAEEGRSFLARPGGGTRIGEKVFAESVTLRTDPFDPRIPGSPWARDGLPARTVTWVEKGVLKELVVDRYWASKTGRAPVPGPTNLILEGGSGTLDDLIAGADRALLVTRFWYIRMVNPQELVQTGLTRDGVWLVERGKITGPVNNFRFNDSPVNLLRNVEAMSAPVASGNRAYPAIRARDFLFTSRSDAV
jgi:predicted Zn-dependent protease